MVDRKVYAVPPRVEYMLTEVGDNLKPILDAMWAWGEAYKERFGESVSIKGESLKDVHPFEPLHESSEGAFGIKIGYCFDFLTFVERMNLDDLFFFGFCQNKF